MSDATTPTGRLLLLVSATVPQPAEGAFNHWYNDEHIPDLLSCPGFLTARRFVAVEAVPKYLAVYDLADESALTSERYLAMRDRPETELAAAVRPLRTDRRRELYREISISS